MKTDKNQAKAEALNQKITELTSDLQRTRADFENYRKNTEARVQSATSIGQQKAILEFLPIIDDIERAIAHLPSELQDNAWANNVVKTNKTIAKKLEKLGVARILAEENTPFNPELHNAIQFDGDDSTDGEEIIKQELQAGYTLNGEVIRHALVKVGRG